jgi:DNA-directed RNA polymerase specialized sigma subunit
MMKTLVSQQAAGKVIQNIAHYITRSWTNAKKKEYGVIAEFDELHPSEQARGTDSDGEDTTVSLLDKASSQSWSRGHHSNAGVVVEETEAEFLVRCMAKRETLPEDLRDISDLWVAGHTAQKIADALGLSRQQVERRKTKIKKAVNKRKAA